MYLYCLHRVYTLVSPCLCIYTVCIMSTVYSWITLSMYLYCLHHVYTLVSPCLCIYTVCIISILLYHPVYVSILFASCLYLLYRPVYVSTVCFLPPVFSCQPSVHILPNSCLCSVCIVLTSNLQLDSLLPTPAVFSWPRFYSVHPANITTVIYSGCLE